ncbi:MAG: efflux RND transporter periplasmic adaptor subunit [Pseudomonadales bacterium]|nr:efflux RND transporter periplasmic adaptor subunit [Pseudomonadales bacterium]
MKADKQESVSAKSDLLRGLRIDSADREPKPSRFPSVPMLLLLTAAFVGVWLYSGYDGDHVIVEAVENESVQHSNPIVEPPTRVEGLSRSSIVLDATGYVTASRQATVSSKITGKVAEVLIEEGDEVIQGQLLARLDNSLLLAQYRLSQSQFDAAKAGLLEMEVQQREAQLKLDRTQQLTDRSLASQADLDQALLALEGVHARIIRLNREITVADSRLQLQAQQLAETEIRAPFGGVVINKAAQPGEIVSPMSAGGSFTRTGICTLVDMQSLEIEVDVSESNINRVFADQRVMVKLNSYPEWEIDAEVITIIPTADRNKATVRVRIRLLQSDPRILPDMGVRVSFLEDRSEHKE